MLPPIESTSITNKNVESIDFFHDFIAFLKRLEQRPIKRTVTGNISLRDIESLFSQLKTTRPIIKEYNEFGWRLQSEDDLQTLKQIKIIAEVMYLTYKRKRLLLLTKNGQRFIKNLAAIQQCTEMVLHYWYRVNWDYFTYGRVANGTTLNEVLQKNQSKLWQSLLHKGNTWIEYRKFCNALRDYFNLQPFLESPYSDPDDELYSDIHFNLFRKNLLLFGCVEIEEGRGKYEWQKEIVRFRPTPLGLYVFYKALYENYL